MGQNTLLSWEIEVIVWLKDVFIQLDRSKKGRELGCSLVEQRKEKRKSGERWIIQDDTIVQKATSNSVYKR